MKLAVLSVTLICSLISLPTTSLNPRGQISLHIYMPLLDIKKKTTKTERKYEIRKINRSG